MPNLFSAIAHSNFLPDLKQEIGSIYLEHEKLVISENPKSLSPLFAQVYSENCELVEFTSISQAAKVLRSFGKFWVPYAPNFFRRSQLIAEQLAKIKNPPLNFLDTFDKPFYGYFSLLTPNQMLVAPNGSSQFPLGEIIFNENKVLPPSRAYLKLWELFTIHQIKPNKGDTVLDFGSCPGGWTWVLQTLGCKVISIDKAPLAPQVLSLPNVTFKKTDAFKLKPEDIGPLDWFFSDIICYPKDLYNLVSDWIKSGLCKNFVCTVKFQGETDFATLENFRKDFSAKVIHLYNNKHEVTVIIQL